MLSSRLDEVRPQRTRTSRILAYTAAASAFALTGALIAGTAAPAAPGGFSSPSASPSANPSPHPTLRTIAVVKPLVVSGTARYDSTIKATGAWTPGSNATYQWYRNSVAIKGATGTSLRLGTADIRAKIHVVAVVKLSGYATRTDTSSSVTVGPALFTSAPAPTISGTAKVGHKLTVSAGAWAPAAATLGYQWYRNGQAVSGATAVTYTLTAADKGADLKARVRAAKGGYTTTDRHSAPVKVAAGTISATKAFKISGTARYGSTLKVSQGWTPGVKITYQWYRNGKPVKGATKSSFALSAKDIGAKITVRATVTKPGYSSRAVTAKAVSVGKAVFSVKTAPKITGTKKAGAILRATTGSFSAKPTSYGHQWYRNGKPISGAKKSSYRVVKADRGQKISVRVTAKRTYYVNKTARSASVRIAAR
ncbi:hypothetical protein E4J89_11440 [Arthrobacter sp. CAU 1506]|uniref:hypothetical protein n=1 Tax=Arthrobacter sp. CAU 1506 TaxID=2560052 RepID=UPI0010AB65CB|nr:hypothetical protein [Arthrobacter sp. CAU 1506]TJY69169.1 hypothetical protein E4J89_11440 [Arthrobacter sp. CAU 1506]